MGRDERYTETYSSVPEGHQGAYLIPPLDELSRHGHDPLRPKRGRRGRRDAVVAPMVMPASVARTGAQSSSTGRAAEAEPAPPRRTNTLARIVFFVVLLAVFIGSGAAGALLGAVPALVDSVTTAPWWPFASGDEPSGEERAPLAPLPTLEPEPTPTFAPAPGLEEFAEVDQAELDAVLADPAAHVGEAIVVYAEVVVADTVEEAMPPGATAHLVSLSAVQPASSYEYFGGTESVLIDPGTEGVDAGDVLRAWLIVPDPASFTSYYAADGLGYARLDVAQAEVVGFHDLMQDVGVGEVYWGEEVPILPVTARNVASQPMEFAIDLSAKRPDGSDAASTVAWTGVVQPGETVTTEVELYGTIPDGVTYHVEGVTRYEE